MNKPLRTQKSVLLILTLWMGMFLLYSAQAQVDTTKKQTEFSEEFSVSDDVQSIASYTLEDCIKYAFRYSETLKLKDIDVRIAHEEVGENLARGLPKIDAEASYQDNFKIQRSFVPAVLFDPAAEPGVFVPVQFQPKFNASASVTLSQLIFDFSYLLGLKAARAYEDLTRRQADLSKVDIAEQVSKAFYAVLIARERLELLDQNYARLDTLYRETQALFENGFSEQIDVMRIEVSRNNLSSEREKAYSAAILTEQVLKFQMGMPLSDSLIIRGSLEDIDLNLYALEKQPVDYTKRMEYEILNRQAELRALNLRYNKALYYPRLEGYVSYGSNTATGIFGDVWRFNERWFGYGNYGLRLVVPIMDGFKRKHTFQKLRLQMEQVQLQQAQFKRGADIDYEQAYNQLASSLNDLQNQKRNMELAKEVSRVSKVKYQNGVGANLEIIDAETSFKEAETNYYAAYYQAIISKIDLEKALGTLLD
ncbi:MAG: TolC family protein [Microscillaceae bacterium]|nr:TolC family protein [Microscillaceae bacterium]